MLREFIFIVLTSFMFAVIVVAITLLTSVVVAIFLTVILHSIHDVYDIMVGILILCCLLFIVARLYIYSV